MVVKHNKINKSFKKRSKLARPNQTQQEDLSQEQVNTMCKVIRKIIKPWLRMTQQISFTASPSYPKWESDYINSIR
jgi:hypothetical protein